MNDERNGIDPRKSRTFVGNGRTDRTGRPVGTQSRQTTMSGRVNQQRRRPAGANGMSARDEAELRRIRMQKKLMRERQLRKKRRIMFGIIGVIFVALAAAGVLLFPKLFGTKSEEPVKVVKEDQGNGTAAQGVLAAVEEQDDAGADEAVITEPETESVLHVSLTEADQYTGNLILVNSQYPYHEQENAHLKLVDIEAAQTVSYKVNYAGMQLLDFVMQPLDQMISACEAETGSTLTGVTSAHRSIEKQQQIFDEYTADYGIDYAKAYVATPGYSEHHTGLSMDLGIYYPDGSDGYFSDSQESAWYDKNAYRFGFIRRYQESKVNITGISNEEWHFRYVGIPHAWYMVQNNLCLEEYLDLLMKTTSQEKPPEVKIDSMVYQIIYTADSSLELPGGTQYTVSGTNRGGYILTVY